MRLQIKPGLFGNEWHLKYPRPEQPSIDYLIAESHWIIDRAFNEQFPSAMLPLYSGGNDSGCSCHVASLHPKFGGKVFTINTRIGAFRTKLHQRAVCRQFGWEQVVGRSKKTIEQFVRERGVPGPGRHSWIYQRIKDHVIKAWVQQHKQPGRPVALLTGCRQAESTRRLGNARPIKRGQSLGDDGTLHGPYELWVGPIVYWTTRDKIAYCKHFDIPWNPFSASLGMSLECCCGAFADRKDFGGPADELELIRQYAPDVYKKIRILERIAKESGKHDVWGTPPKNADGSLADEPNEPTLFDDEEGLPPLCQSCGAKYHASCS